MRTRNRRRGFTLVELLVATTLTIFIMLILTSAFRAGLDAFRLLRATGQLQEKLRAATSIIRRDLTAEHFGPASDSFDGPYLRDQRLDVLGWKPPTQGFFRIQQNAESGPLPYTIEQQDSDSIPTNRSIGHILHFTARLSQAKQSDYYTGAFSDPTTTTGATLLREQFGIPGYTIPASGIFASEWAEIAYFLVPVGGKQTTGPTPVSTFALCRKQRLVTHPGSTGSQVPRVNPLTSPEISYQSTTDGNYFTTASGNPGGNAVNTVEDLTQPNNRMDANTSLPTAGAYAAGAYLGTGTTGSRPRALSEFPSLSGFAGNDILLTNVISFEVKAIWNSLGTVHAKPSGVAAEDNDAPFFYLPSTKLNTSASLPAGTRLFDTWSRAVSPSGIDWTNGTTGTSNALTQSPQQVPQRIRIQQLQIRLRIWDTKAEQTRQITIVQDV